MKGRLPPRRHSSSRCSFILDPLSFILNLWPIATTITKRPSKSTSAAAGCRMWRSTRPSGACSPTAARSRASISSSPRPGPITWLVDVKGRRFPSGDIQKQYWKNWSTRDDLRSLAQWERLFGATFCGLFVFAYDVLGRRAPLPAEQLFEFRGQLYGFVAVRLADYAACAHPISTELGHAGDVGRRFPPPGPAAGGVAGRLPRARARGSSPRRHGGHGDERGDGGRGMKMSPRELPWAGRRAGSSARRRLQQHAGVRYNKRRRKR